MATDPKRTAKAVPRNRLGAVTYLKSADHTRRVENGGSRLVGAALGVYLTVLKIGGESIGRRPLLFLSVLLIVVGIQLLTLGLLAQMLVPLRRRQAGARFDSPPIERLLGFGDATSSVADGSARSATETSLLG
jgi:hypothetical protein